LSSEFACGAPVKYNRRINKGNQEEDIVWLAAMGLYRGLYRGGWWLKTA